MSLQPISEPVFNPKMYRGSKKEEVKTPDFYCKDCEKRCENRCAFYNRPVVPDYNRCFNHSFYSPVHNMYKEPENLVELVELEEKKIA